VASSVTVACFSSTSPLHGAATASRRYDSLLITPTALAPHNWLPCCAKLQYCQHTATAQLFLNAVVNAVVNAMLRLSLCNDNPLMLQAYCHCACSKYCGSCCIPVHCAPSAASIMPLELAGMLHLSLSCAAPQCCQPCTTRRAASILLQQIGCFGMCVFLPVSQGFASLYEAAKAGCTGAAAAA